MSYAEFEINIINIFMEFLLVIYTAFNQKYLSFILVTTFKKTFGVWWSSFKHIKSTMIHISVFENWQMWWTVTIPPSSNICIQWARFKNQVYGTACSKPTSQKSAGGHMCISACSSSIGSWTTSTIPILHRYWWWEMVSLY